MWPVAGLLTHSPSCAVITALALACAACKPAAHVSLEPQYGECAPPAIINLIQIIAYAGDTEHTETLARDETLAIDTFPPDTTQIGVILHGANGAITHVGKSAPLAFNDLGDGAKIPIFVAPLDGFCAIGGMIDNRIQPLVAPAGDGVLIVGGFAPMADGSPGAPLSTVEFYDPSTSTFAAVKIPEALVDGGFDGATLTPMPDGRLALIGGPQRAFTVFDPAARAFTDAPALIDAHLFHAAVATEAGEVIVVGGCSSLDKTGACVPRHQIVAYAPGALGDPDTAFPLMTETRQAPQLFDLGEQVDGRTRYLITGGGAPGADRFAPGDATTETIEGGSEQAAQLDGGAVLTAFVTDARTAAVTGTAAVYVPDADPARTVLAAPVMTGARMIGLEDGRAAAFGTVDRAGVPTTAALRFDPTRNRWDTDVFATGGPPGLIAPSLVRLGDGSVLVFGGTQANTAWRYRPSLVGPASGSVTAIPGDPNDPMILTPVDPATVRVVAGTGDWHLRIPAGTADAPAHPALARALVGGPRMAAGSVSAVVTVIHGGAALIAEQTAPGRAYVAMFTTGQPARVVQLAGGAATAVCEGDAVPTLAAGSTIALAIRGRSATLTVDRAAVAQCTLPTAEPGAWGVAAIGPDPKPDGDDADVTVGSVTVARQ
jgi:hypothetical protein